MLVYWVYLNVLVCVCVFVYMCECMNVCIYVCNAHKIDLITISVIHSY